MIICSYNENHKHASPMLAGVYASSKLIFLRLNKNMKKIYIFLEDLIFL